MVSVWLQVRAPMQGAGAKPPGVAVDPPKGYAEFWAGSYVVHTGQLFFPDSLYDELEHVPPYTDDIMTRILNNQDK